MIKWVVISGFDKRITGVVYSTGCDKQGVISVVAKEFGCHTPSR